MRYNNFIINLLLNGANERAITEWNRIIKKILSLEPKDWTYKQFNNLYGTMDFILNFDPFIKGVVNKRLFLIKSYDYTIAESYNSFILQHYDTFFKMLYNVIYHIICNLAILFCRLAYGGSIE